MKFLFLLFTAILAGVSAIFAQSGSLQPTIDTPVYFDISPPLRAMYQPAVKPTDRSWKEWTVPNRFNPNEPAGDHLQPPFVDPVWQETMGSLVIDTIISNFEGINASGSVPPDTYGEAGPEHYFQVVNTSYAIFNKTGEVVFGPVPNGSIWQGIPNNANSGDAVVLWDEEAQRWLFSQFSLPNYPAGPFFQMIAVSQTADPMGAWYRYQYEFPYMPDYPKFGVWPDGYYMSSNNFGTGFSNNGAYGYDRDAMLSGDPDAVRISFTLQAGGAGFGFSTMYPSDCDGEFPPLGTPNYFGFIKRSGSQYFGIYEFHADFDEPSNSTFGNLLQLPVSAFNADLDGIPQLGTSIKLEDISDRLMYNNKFRKFNDHWAMVANHTVNVGGGRAGVRWYEFRKGSGAWTIHQEGTYAPQDGLSRWMGSMAIDTAGSIALGYSVSSATMYPSIRVTGRLVNDPLGEMTIEEKSIIEGGGSQTGMWSGRSRWGDYSGMSVDPSNPTTFWYTTEYYPTTSNSSWHTRIGSFTFDNIFSTAAGADPALFCQGDDTIQLSAMAYGGSGAYTWSWSSIPPGFASTSQNPVAIVTDTTRFIVETSDGSTTRSDTVMVTVVFPPEADAGPDTTICAWAGALELHGQASSYRYFVWGSFGDGEFEDDYALETLYYPGEQDRANGGTKIVLVAFAQSPCLGKIMDTLNLVIDPCTGMDDPRPEEMRLAILPNPASAQATLMITGIRAQQGTMTITSIEGKKVHQGLLEISEGRHETTLDLSGFRPGIYLVQVQSETGIAVEKLVVQ